MCTLQRRVQSGVCRPYVLQCFGEREQKKTGNALPFNYALIDKRAFEPGICLERNFGGAPNAYDLCVRRVCPERVFRLICAVCSHSTNGEREVSGAIFNAALIVQYLSIRLCGRVVRGVQINNKTLIRFPCKIAHYFTVAKNIAWLINRWGAESLNWFTKEYPSKAQLIYSN